MSKKIILIVIAIIILGVAGCLIYKPTNPATPGPKLPVDARNAAYVIEGEETALINGRAETQAVEDSASKVITQYFGNDVKADFNGDRINDMAFLLTQNSGGSGTFYYVAAIISQDNNYRGVNTILLGDRIAPQTTEFQNGEIIVNYADRKPGEPMTAIPSVGVSRYFKIDSGNLVEIIKNK